MPRAARNISLLVLALLILLPALASAGELLPVGEVPVPTDNPMSTEKVELGKMLFFDRRLSGDGIMACVTCHDPNEGFSDGLDISMSYPTTRNWRNAPTLINIGLNENLFHDGRAASLEEQALFPVMSTFEMNQNLDFVEEEIREVPEYVKMFRRVFGGDVTRERMALALAAFQRTLVSRNSPLDRHLRGEEGILSEEAKLGLQVFKGKGKCAECHYGANLQDGDFHALNVPENPKLLNDPRIAITRRFVAKVSGFENYKYLTEDPGRFLVTKDSADWKAFKTPTLRDISRTGPYMHNGVFGSLEETVEFFDRGGGQGNSALKPLGLTPEEKRALRIFMEEALTGDPITFSLPKIPEMP